MALRNALNLVRGLRKQISETEEDVMATTLLEETGRITRLPDAREQRAIRFEAATR
jgi:hypothetical protein